jgi:hypothetical protein
MIEQINSSIDYGSNPPDYSQKIADFLTENYPDVVLPARTSNLMTNALEQAYYLYGLGQTDETRRAYHNDEHAFEVFQRSVAWLKRFEDHFDITFTTQDYEVVGIAAAHHDIVIGAKDPEFSDEALSAMAAADAMYDSPAKFSARIRRRVKQAIEATTVEYRNGGVFQTQVMTGRPDFAVVAVALADSSAILTEPEEKVIDHISSLAIENLPPGLTDITTTTDVVMKLLRSEEDFIRHRLDDLQKYLEFLSDDPDKAKSIFEKYFAERRQRLGRFTTHIDSRLSDIQQAVTDVLADSKETTERTASKVYRGILRGLRWLPPTE